MTVADVVAMGRYPYTGGLGILTPKDEAVVAQCMEQIRISPLKERNFMSLSDGQKQRIPDGKGGWKNHREDTTDWNDKGNVEIWRAAWAAYTNRALESAGRPERIDHRKIGRAHV